MFRRSVFVAVCALALADVAYAQEFVAFAGGGFSGKRIPFQVERLVINADGSTNKDVVNVQVEHEYDWRPTVTGGVEARWHRAGDVKKAYVGLGGFFAVLSTDGNPNKLAPGAAVTFGKGDYGFILGAIFAGTDEILLPNRAKTFQAQAGDVPDFRTQGTSNTPHLFIGFRGVSLNFGKSSDATAEAADEKEEKPKEPTGR